MLCASCTMPHSIIFSTTASVPDSSCLLSLFTSLLLSPYSLHRPHSRCTQRPSPAALCSICCEGIHTTMAPHRSGRQSQSVSVASAPRSSRHAKPAISYLDPSSDEDDDEDDGFDSEADYEAPGAGRKRGRPSSAHPDSSDVILYESTPRRRQPPAKPRMPQKGALKETIKPKVDVDTYSAGIIPPWQTLPYHILLQIFQYVSYPLVDERTFQQTANWSWLLKASKLCRAFSEPALTVLYRSPCLTPMERAHTYVLPLPHQISIAK
jgi:hypothetical protein